MTLTLKQQFGHVKKTFTHSLGTLKEANRQMRNLGPIMDPIIFQSLSTMLDEAVANMTVLSNVLMQTEVIESTGSKGGEVS